MDDAVRGPIKEQAEVSGDALTVLVEQWRANAEDLRTKQRDISLAAVPDTQEFCANELAALIAAGRSAATEPESQTMADAAERLWVVLANVSGGDWTTQTQEWQEAAARWRDHYFAVLGDGDDGKHDTP